MDTLRLGAFLILLAVIVADVSAIACYECNSFMDPECANLKVNDTSSKYYKTCAHTEESAGNELFCRKTVQKIFDLEEVHTRIIRSCGWIRYSLRECYQFKNKGHEDESCQCFTDGCNSAPISVPSMSYILVLPIISSIYLSST